MQVSTCIWAIPYLLLARGGPTQYKHNLVSLLLIAYFTLQPDRMYWNDLEIQKVA